MLYSARTDASLTPARELSTSELKQVDHWHQDGLHWQARASFETDEDAQETKEVIISSVVSAIVGLFIIESVPIQIYV